MEHIRLSNRRPSQSWHQDSRSRSDSVLLRSEACAILQLPSLEPLQSPSLGFTAATRHQRSERGCSAGDTHAREPSPTFPLIPLQSQSGTTAFLQFEASFRAMSTYYQAVVTRVPATMPKGSLVTGFIQPPRGSDDWPPNVSRAGLSFRVDDVKSGIRLDPGCYVRFTLMLGTNGPIVKHVYAQQSKITSSPSVGSSASSTASVSRTSSSSSSYSSNRPVPPTARPVVAATGLSQMVPWQPRRAAKPALRHSRKLSQTDLRTAYDIGLLHKSHTF